MNGKQLKNSILQWAIQGKLVPQDPNDEPASVLLEKIRTEKARLVKEGKIKKDKKESIIYRGEDNSYYEKFADGTVKCIDEEIPFEIPNGWEWCRLSNVINLLSGQDLTPDRYAANSCGIPYITGASNFTNGKLIVNRYTNFPTSISKKGDLLITCKGTVGTVAFNDVGDIHIARQIMAISCYRIDKLYVKAFLELMTPELEKKAHSIIPGISRNILLDTLIPIPPFYEQNRIVNKIEELTPDINVFGIAQQRKTEQNIKIKTQLRNSILQEAIQGKLVPQNPDDESASVLLEKILAEKQRLVETGQLKPKDVASSFIFKDNDNKYYEQINNSVTCIDEEIPFEIPDSWRWCRLRTLCSISTGATFKKEESDTNASGIRILRGGNIQPFSLIFKDDDIFLPEERVKKDILLKKNDIVTPAVTSLESVGKMTRIDEDMNGVTVGGFVFIIRPYYGSETFSKYALIAMSSPSTVDYIKSITNKSGQAFYNIGKERLYSTLIPIPPQEEQLRIVKKIECLFDKIKV